MKNVFFRFLSTCILFLYGYSQVIPQDSIDYFSNIHSDNFIPSSNFRLNNAQVYRNTSTLNIYNSKVKVEDIELDDDATKLLLSKENKKCYFKNFYSTHAPGNFFFYLKSNLFLFKQIPQFFTPKRSVLFQIFRI